MKTYILFIFGMFEDHEDIQFFCTEILGASNVIDSVRYVIENSQNIIVIFDSKYENEKLSKEVYDLLLNDSVKFYFLIERDTLVSAHLPETIRDFIFKPFKMTEVMRIEYTHNQGNPSMDLDELLEKIEKMGIESLTPEEKKFLDNFE
jgi:hypothetical protein